MPHMGMGELTQPPLFLILTAKIINASTGASLGETDTKVDFGIIFFKPPSFGLRPFEFGTPGRGTRENNGEVGI